MREATSWNMKVCVYTTHKGSDITSSLELYTIYSALRCGSMLLYFTSTTGTPSAWQHSSMRVLGTVEYECLSVRIVISKLLSA